MRDLSPGPMESTYATRSSIAAMPRKSRVSAPCTWRRFQLFPASVERRMTPFDPETHTTGVSLAFGSEEYAALTPRRFVSVPLVCTVHHCACTAAAATEKYRTARKIARMPRMLPRSSAPPRFSLLFSVDSLRSVLKPTFTITGQAACGGWTGRKNQHPTGLTRLSLDWQHESAGRGSTPARQNKSPSRQ